MRQKTKELICSALVRSESIANRMAKIMNDSEIELLVNGIIVDATIKEGKQEEVINKIPKKAGIDNIVITKVTGHCSTVQVYYKSINEDGTEGLDLECKMFDLNFRPEYEELFDLQVILELREAGARLFTTSQTTRQKVFVPQGTSPIALASHTYNRIRHNCS